MKVKIEPMQIDEVKKDEEADQTNFDLSVTRFIEHKSVDGTNEASNPKEHLT